jgi:hypothetical protein
MDPDPGGGFGGPGSGSATLVGRKKGMKCGRDAMFNGFIRLAVLYVYVYIV